MRSIYRVALIGLAGIASTGVMAQAAKQGPVELAALIGTVKDATLNAIKTVSSNGRVEDYEGAILFALDRIQVPFEEMDAGLVAASGTLADGPAKQAIANIRAMKARLSGTGAVPTGTSSLLNGPGLGGGGGGTSNYAN